MGGAGERMNEDQDLSFECETLETAKLRSTAGEAQGRGCLIGDKNRAYCRNAQGHRMRSLGGCKDKEEKDRPLQEATTPEIRVGGTPRMTAKGKPDSKWKTKTAVFAD